MVKMADYIRRIEIKSLWSGRKHVVWELHPDVNILSGVNGVGKTTILNKLVYRLHADGAAGALSAAEAHGVKIDFEPADATAIRFDVIRSFDRPLVQSDLLGKVADAHVATELDLQLYQLQRRYLDYQVNIGNRMISLLTGGDPDAREKATAVANAKRRFQDMVDELFNETGKKIDRTSNEIRFEQMGEILLPHQLSSGEKQMLAILLTVLIEDRQPYALFMDEPEVSLHVEWQQRLIGLIRELNPHAQVVLTTHSPAVIMDGWLDAVTEVSDITE